MSVPPIPPPLESLGSRPFAFYPPILGVEHNEWRYRRATWSELIVFNTKNDEEICIPRRFLGEVSRIDEPLVIVGLRKELEYKMGQVWPHERRVIEMPRAVNDFARPMTEPEEPPASTAHLPAPVVSIRLESGTERKVGRLISIVLIASILFFVLAVSFFRGRAAGTHVTYSPVLQSDLDLTPQDDYYSIISRWGKPQYDTWRAGSSELQFRKLYYPSRGLSVILMGREQNKALYVGAMNEQWQPVHTVNLPTGGNTASLLAHLPRF